MKNKITTWGFSSDKLEEHYKVTGTVETNALISHSKDADIAIVDFDTINFDLDVIKLLKPKVGIIGIGDSSKGWKRKVKASDNGVDLIVTRSDLEDIHGGASEQEILIACNSLLSKKAKFHFTQIIAEKFPSIKDIVQLTLSISSR